MIVTDLFESAPDVAEALGDNRPKLGSKRDQGKSVRQWRRDRGMDESGMAEYSLNELSSDLLQKSAQVAKNKSRQAMDPNIHDALGGGYTNPLAKHYDSLSQKFNDRAAKVGQRDAVKKIASPAVMRKIGMTEQGMAESHGNYAGDTPVNLGGVSMKMIQAGDTVQYIDQQAQVVDMSPDRKYSRITIPSSSTTKTVLTSDLRQLGQGMRESDDEQLDELGWKDLGSKIFGSSPNTTAAPGSLSPRFSAHIPNPATRKPYTQSELRALAAKKATAAAASAEPAASAAPIPATPKAVQTKKSSSDSFTPDEISRMTPFYQKQLAGITEALAQPVAEMLQMVETKEDVQRIKQFVDQTFVRYGAVNESAFIVRNQILEHVTQVGAQRRRDFAAQRTH